MKTLMTIERVRELLSELDKEDIPYAVIAGFGLDGIRGFQSRPHQDIDILVLKKDSGKIVALTDQLGYHGKWYNDLYKIKRDDGAKADLAMATIEGDEIVTYGRAAITRIPRALFESPQRGHIGEFEYKIAPNEVLKTYGLHAQKGEDAKFAEGLKGDTELMKKIKRTLRESQNE